MPNSNRMSGTEIPHTTIIRLIQARVLVKAPARDLAKVRAKAPARDPEKDRAKGLVKVPARDRDQVRAKAAARHSAAWPGNPAGEPRSVQTLA